MVEWIQKNEVTLNWTLDQIQGRRDLTRMKISPTPDYLWSRTSPTTQTHSLVLVGVCFWKCSEVFTAPGRRRRNAWLGNPRGLGHRVPPFLTGSRWRPMSPNPWWVTGVTNVFQNMAVIPIFTVLNVQVFALCSRAWVKTLKLSGFQLDRS